MKKKAIVGSISSPGAAVYEAYNMAKIDILLTVKEAGCKKIMITSPTKNEEKGDTAANLALAMSRQENVKVILVDCDFKKPDHKDFLLTAVDGVFIKEKVPYSLDAKTLPPNPSELLSNSKYRDILNSVETAYDYILFDAPPANVVSDALLLARECDGVVLCIKQKMTRHVDIKETLSIFDRLSIKLLGLIVHEA